MFENSLVWAVSELGEFQLTKLTQLLTHERAQRPDVKEYSSVAIMAGTALDAERNGLPIAVRDNVAIIPVRGIMLKSYPWPSNYVSSTAHIRAAVRAARLDATIAHIVILSDTPGGDVRGLHELTDEIAAASQDKNVVVQIEGTLASAGYHFAAPANAIYASHRMNSIGSIGVRTVLWDTSRMYQNAGIDVHKIDTGEHKSTGLEGVPVTDAQLAETQRVVDQLYAEFLAVIIKGRGVSMESLKPLADGRVWFAHEALEHKLIDAIQPLEKTLASLSQRERVKPRMTRAEAGILFAGM